ncbi:protein kinase domain protein [Ichthyophthirius multifiliis]|uniref:Protein kinase domain protein n=1 Tax=Ichthyophthirius multifiliis TaxID=5932 RepID=G0QWH8_ICHMU|nr:protein kinase domain protein [Ichthyophthirius multifiliis]EGR30423.1 protein kinase domain protein [Ichthyophthirius multifiliis]|eukprot:XP_004032010.1 protein kinase domain protein [Ichthyophthirius multifiliis]
MFIQILYIYKQNYYYIIIKLNNKIIKIHIYIYYQWVVKQINILQSIKSLKNIYIYLYIFFLNTSIKLTSFFDDSDKNKQQTKKIWQKPTKDQEILNKKIFLLQSKFYKKSKSKQKLKTRHYYIDDSNLYVSKSEKSEKIQGFLNLNCCKLDILENIDIKQFNQTSLMQGFRLIRNGKYIEIYTDDQLIFKEWRNVITLNAIQQNFHEDFIVTKIIGKGSFAKVYLATKKQNNQQYAIKAFNKEFMLNQHKGKESLINEIIVMRNLRNEHLINLYEVYETANSIYFVVDIINGGELLHRLREKKTIKESDLKNLIRNLLLGLQYLHQKQIMHRDLKPENLLLKSKENDYDLVIADLGLATFTNIKNILFKRCGTPGFVAPEVLAYQDGGSFYDVKCDIYSAGVIFYLLLTGKQPFEGKDYKAILRANRESNIQYDIPELDTVSIDAKDLLIKMLRSNPSERFSASECLGHPFLNQSQDQQNYQNLEFAQQNLKNYEVGYLSNIRNKNQTDSQEQIGSLALHSNGIPAMNGNIDTMGSLSNYSNANLGNKENKELVQSKFSTRAKTESIDSNILKNQLHLEVKNKEKNNLHKMAIQNNMNK